MTKRAGPAVWGLQDHPALKSDVVRVGVAEHLLLARDVGHVVVLLDPFLRVIGESLDGSSTIEELASDIAEAAEVPFESAREHVDTLVAALAADGLLEGAADRPPRPHRTRVSGGASVHLRSGRERLEVRGPEHAVAKIRTALGTYLDDAGAGGAREDATAHLIELAEGGADHAEAAIAVDGRLVWGGAAGGTAAEALVIATTEAIESPEGAEVKLAGLAITRDERILFIHPLLAERMLELLPALEAEDVRVVGSGVHSVLAGEVRSLRAEDGTTTILHPAGVLTDRSWDPPELARQVIELGYRLSPTSVLGTLELLDHLPAMVAGSLDDAALLAQISQVLPPTPVVDPFADLFEV